MKNGKYYININDQIVKRIKTDEDVTEQFIEEFGDLTSIWKKLGIDIDGDIVYVTGQYLTNSLKQRFIKKPE